VERLVRLPGTHNLRDTGGHPAGAGVTRWGKLYRSDALHRLGDDGRRERSIRRIGLVIDLRNPSERDRFPSDLGGVDATAVPVPVLADPPETFVAADVSLDDFYHHIVEERGHALVQALRVIASSGPTPVIVHCTSGKDRTGLVVALALALVGVDRSAIVADYAASEQNLPAALLDQTVDWWRQTGNHRGVNLDALVRLSQPAVLERTFERIETRHGSVAGYARAYGLSDQDRRLLNEVLVEAPSVFPRQRAVSPPIGLPQSPR
jgi:protein-tyrosine phosphatase